MRVGPRDPSLLARDMAQQATLLSGLLASSDLAPARALLQVHDVVRLVGIGSSQHVAAYGAACLESMGSRVATVLAAPGSGVPQPRLSPEDLLIVVSQSGATPALLELTADAREAGAGVLALTNAPGSPLEDLAHTVLPCAAGQESVVPATKSVTTAMLLLRALAAPVHAGAVHRLADAVADTALPSVGIRPPGFVVAGGFAGKAVADEVSLKLAEVAGLAAVPESLVDFLHGPVAVPVPVLALVDDDDPNLPALGQLHLHRLRSATTGDQSLDRIAQVAAGQLLALSWARELGVNPDDSKGLAKVTLTA
ncbi:MAG: SIS domain-containing protein [Actinomycetota bacterium]|nr:SIS domain-containing protein [Actinomycetota bacterium]